MKRTLKIVGVVLMVTLGTLAAYADNCAQNLNQPYGSPDTQYSPLGPAIVTNPITTYCSSSFSSPSQAGPYYTQSSPDRVSFINATGQQYLDTINWEVNPFNGTTSPVFFDGGTGQAMSPPDFPNLPYGGGVNGTGYSFGSVPSTAGFPDEGANQMDLAVTNGFGTLPNNGLNGDPNLLAGTTNGLALALGWDTSTTGTLYNPNNTDSGSLPCYSGGTADPGGTPSSPNYDPDAACWDTVGPNRGSPITGVGFDIQLTQTAPDGETVYAPFSVTFAIYGATPGCSPNGFDSMLGNPQPPEIQCYEYQQAGMTDNQGNSAQNGFCASDDDPTCADYNASNVQLLGYVTIDSNETGGPAFFGFTTNDPYGVGEVVMVGNTFGQGENSDVNFAINQVTLLTQQPSTTPEPTTLLLFGSGLLVAARRLRKKTIKA